MLANKLDYGDTIERFAHLKQYGIFDIIKGIVIGVKYKIDSNNNKIEILDKFLN